MVRLSRRVHPRRYEALVTTGAGAAGAAGACAAGVGAGVAVGDGTGVAAGTAWLVGDGVADWLELTAVGLELTAVDDAGARVVVCVASVEVVVEAVCEPCALE